MCSKEAGRKTVQTGQGPRDIPRPDKAGQPADRVAGRRTPCSRRSCKTATRRKSPAKRIAGSFRQEAAKELKAPLAPRSRPQACESEDELRPGQKRNIGHAPQRMECELRS